MKLKLEVVNTVPEDSAVVLKPIECGLKGLLVYKGIPVRARERFLIGAVVEADVPLPDFYPDNHSSYGFDAKHGCLPVGYDKHDTTKEPRIPAHWACIDRAPLNERILLGAFDYFGPGKHAVVIGKGTPPPERFRHEGALPSWRADLGNGEQDFTPTHWQPIPRLVEHEYSGSVLVYNSL
jgi:hypothetical protein